MTTDLPTPARPLTQAFDAAVAAVAAVEQAAAALVQLVRAEARLAAVGVLWVGIGAVLVGVSAVGVWFTALGLLIALLVVASGSWPFAFLIALIVQAVALIGVALWTVELSQHVKFRRTRAQLRTLLAAFSPTS
jgi:hypothetical protein